MGNMNEPKFNLDKLVRRINDRFGPDFGWPERFVVAEQTTGGFKLRVGWGDIEFDEFANEVGAGTDMVMYHSISESLRRLCPVDQPTECTPGP